MSNFTQQRGYKMRSIILSHDSLINDIIIVMHNDKGLVMDTGSSCTLDWQDDNGEDEIFDIAYAWLKFRSGAHIPDYTNYSQHKWWKTSYTPAQRLDFINKEEFTE